MKALHSKKKSFHVWGILALCVGIFFWNPLHITQHTKGFVHNLFEPLMLQSTQLGSRLASMTSVFTNLHNLREESEKNKNDLFTLTAQIAALQHVAYENEQLRAIVDLPIVTQKNAVAADVMMRDFSGEGWVLVNRGSRDGIAVDDLVVTADNILIGRIYEVTPSSAYARLSTHEDSVFRVVKAGTTQTAVAQGSHGIAISVEHIASDADIQPGDVFLLHDTKNADADALHLSIGSVQEVTTEDDRLSQSARLVPLYDVNTVAHVFILHTTD